MPKWSDFGNIFSTMREIDVSAIRDEAERPILISCIGHERALAAADQLLHQGHQRYPSDQPDPLDLVPLARAAERAASLSSADLLLLTVDAQAPLSASERAAFGRLEALSTPFMVLVVYGDQLQAGDEPLPPLLRSRTLAIRDPNTLDAADRLAAALLTRLPSELHLAAARRLPGLRGVFARELIGSVAFTNATYSLASGLPEQIPLVSVPFAAADILVLTKNQALLVYRLALAYGAPPDFQARIREVLPVIGGAFLWRQAARSLIGLIPVWGLVPKIAVAYAGTYTTGIAAWRWYESGDLVSSDQLKRISSEAILLGRKRAAELIARARAGRAEKAGTDVPTAPDTGLLARLRRLNPLRRKPRELAPPE